MSAQPDPSDAMHPHKLNLTQALAIVVALDELTTKYNVESTRLSNGLQLMREGKAQYSRSTDGWICFSQDGGDVYAVDLDLGLCSCGDAVNRRLLCKHFICVWLTHRVNSLLAAAKVLITPTLPQNSVRHGRNNNFAATRI